MNHPADSAKAAEDEALGWLVDLDDLSEVDQARFHAWLDARPENRLAFEKVEREWRQLDVVRQLATDAPDPRVIDKWLWRRRLRRRYLPLAAAASIAALAAVTLLLLPREYDAHFTTAIGEHREIVLPDETVVSLNTNSELTVHYDSGERKVQLSRGEAHFAIAPAPERPFSVLAGTRTVRAVGTAFNVYLKADVVEVTVLEGVVEVLPDTQKIGEQQAAGGTSHPPIPENTTGEVPAEVARVRQGQRLEYNEEIETVSRVDPAELGRRLAWQVGMLDFQGDDLSKVIEEAGRYTEVRLVIVDPEIEGLHVTGYFRAGDIDTLLKLIESNERVSVHRVNPSVVHIAASRQ